MSENLYPDHLPADVGFLPTTAQRSGGPPAHGGWEGAFSTICNRPRFGVLCTFSALNIRCLPVQTKTEKQSSTILAWSLKYCFQEHTSYTKPFSLQVPYSKFLPTSTFLGAFTFNKFLASNPRDGSDEDLEVNPGVPGC